jgi:5-hydroxyisourate hydrolase
MSTISTHVLDTSLGKPAAGITVKLERDNEVIASEVTDSDGRVRDLLGDGQNLSAGSYTLLFSVGEYFATDGRESFYDMITISFRISSDSEHYHVPLLLSPFGYSTYRGS